MTIKIPNDLNEIATMQLIKEQLSMEAKPMSGLEITQKQALKGGEA